MAELVPFPETIQPLDALPVELASIVQAYQRASKAGSTVKAYRGDAVLFEA